MLRKRSIRCLLAVASVSIFGCSAAPVPSDGTGATPPADVHTASGQGITTELQLRHGMDAAWMRLAHWTDIFAIEGATSAADAPAARARMMDATRAVAETIAPAAGTEASNELRVLMFARSGDIVAWVEAERSGDTLVAEKATTALDRNASDLAAFFETLGVASGGGAGLESTLRQVTQATQALVTAQMAGDWQGVVDAASGSHKVMSNVATRVENAMIAKLATSIVPMTTGDSMQEGLASNLDEAAFWTRMTAIDGAGVLPRANDAQAGLGFYLGGFYGASFQSQAVTLLHQVAADAYAYVSAVATGEPSGVATARAQWDADVAQLTQSLAAQNTSWSDAELRALAQADAVNAQAQIDARHGGQWPADAQAYDASLASSWAFAAALGKGLAEQFPKGI
ncbi:MAG TPA: hypothetical protein VGH28_13165 [Polyangiaceae bacterium]